jgi:hypothetical protein
LLSKGAHVRDFTTDEAPHAFSEGIRLVVVNGTSSWEAGDDVIQRAGRVLRRV